MRIAVAGGTGVVGRYVVEAAAADGHEVVVLSRSRGVDLRSGQGLKAALDGVEAIVDVTNAGTVEREAATAFFTEVSGRLQAVGAARGARHIVTLSIVGIDRAPESPYFSAKLRQEEVALAGPVPATVLRATQFHEFPVQVMRRGTRGSTAYVPSTRVQTVAARTVGERLVELAVSPAVGMAQDLAGPQEGNLLELARAFVRRYSLQITVLPAPANPAVPPGANLPTAAARLEGPTFAEWLETEDAARMARRG